MRHDLLAKMGKMRNANGDPMAWVPQSGTPSSVGPCVSFVSCLLTVSHSVNSGRRTDLRSTTLADLSQLYRLRTRVSRLRGRQSWESDL